LCLVALQVSADSLYFGSLTFTTWNFVQFNLFQGLSAFYGTHPWHWYLHEGLAVVLMFVVPWFWTGAGLLVRRGQGRTLVSMIACAVGFLSLSPHKEHRFLLPLLPAAIPVAAYGLCHLKWKKFFLWLAVCLNIPVLIYLSLWHQAAPLATMDFLRHQPVTSVLFLVNCHGTPFYSHLHQPYALYFLPCEPT
jgi:phosphatidylinositol glycan class B